MNVLAALRAGVGPTGRTIRGRRLTVEQDNGHARLVQQDAARGDA